MKITQNKNEYDRKADNKIKNYVVKSFKNTLNNFFNEKNAGKPKFHSYRKSKLSYTSDKPIIKLKQLHLPKVGEIKYIGTLLQEDVAKFTVSKKNSKYYCSIIYKNVAIESKIHTNKYLGMDLGEKTFHMDSNGDKHNPKIDFDLELQIRVLQQRLSNKVLYSNNWYELKLEIDKLKEYRSNALDYWEHQLSYDFVSDYDQIFVENIVHKKLHTEQKHGVSKLKKVYYRMGMFLEKINYKLKWYKDTELLEVDKNNTSKICHICGYKNAKMSLNQRVWICPECDTFHDRDVNAAINIKHKRMIILGKELGTNFFSWEQPL